MALPRGDTTRCSIHGARQTESDSGTGHDQSMRKSVGSSTRGSRFTALWLRTPWLQECSSISSPPPPHVPKDNEEVNAHMKHLQAMLDTATVIDPALDHDNEARGQDLDHR
jgi:hypothetical protein